MKHKYDNELKNNQDKCELLEFYSMVALVAMVLALSSAVGFLAAELLKSL